MSRSKERFHAALKDFSPLFEDRSSPCDRDAARDQWVARLASHIVEVMGINTQLTDALYALRRQTAHADEAVEILIGMMEVAEVSSSYDT
jgi:hypothetical protein